MFNLHAFIVKRKPIMQCFFFLEQIKKGKKTRKKQRK